METFSLDLPAMFGDHHVIEVRRLLLEMPGVEDVYASSCFHALEVSFDPAKLDGDTIKAKLNQAGYIEKMETPVEAGVATYGRDGEHKYFRHTTAYEQVGLTVNFAQNVSHSRRPLWPCPGMGAVKMTNEDE